jgi:hypothetical protein
MTEVQLNTVFTNKQKSAKFKIHMGVTMKGSVFWDLMLCGLVPQMGSALPTTPPPPSPPKPTDQAEYLLKNICSP